MRGAYEGLMKAQAIPQTGPAQSMGGRAMTTGWRDVEPVATSQIDQILAEMDALQAKYPDPNMDVLPEDAAHMGHLRQMLHASYEWQQHAQAKLAEQMQITDEMNRAKLEGDIQKNLRKGATGQIPPPPQPPSLLPRRLTPKGERR